MCWWWAAPGGKTVRQKQAVFVPRVLSEASQRISIFAHPLARFTGPGRPFRKFNTGGFAMGSLLQRTAGPAAARHMGELALDVAAVHHQVGGGDVARLLRGQEDGGRGDLPRLRDAF